MIHTTPRAAAVSIPTTAYSHSRFVSRNPPGTFRCGHPLSPSGPGFGRSKSCGGGCRACHAVSRPLPPRPRPPGRVRRRCRQRQAQPRPRPARRGAVRLPGQGHADGQASATTSTRPLEVLRGRVDALGVAESDAGPPGREPDPRRAARRHQRRGGAGGRGADRQTAKLTIHEVSAPPSPTPSPPRRATSSCPPTRATRSRSAPRVIRRGDHRRRRRAAPAAVDWVVASTSTARAATAWADITGKAACNPAGDPKRRVAIVLDDEIISSPEVNEAVRL